MAHDLNNFLGCGRGSFVERVLYRQNGVRGYYHYSILQDHTSSAAVACVHVNPARFRDRETPRVVRASLPGPTQNPETLNTSQRAKPHT